VSLCGVDVRGGGHASFGRHITVFAWSTDIWNSGEDEAAFYRYLRSKDADIYLLQEYLFWSEDAVRIDQYERLRAEFPGHEIRVEGELITLSRFPIVATHPRPVGGGSQWYWHGSKAQRVDVLVNDRVVSVYNVHLQVPLRVEHFPLSPVFLIFVHQQYHSREAELDRLRADVDANPNPVVVVGDFNSAWMDTLIPMGDRLIRHDPTTRSPLLATWPTAAYSAPRWWRFDWLFTTSDVRVNDYRFTRSLSDHTAQEIRISLKEDDHADD
jgi:endonuclease/exonuclease/phosphatase (EEP) superfamily protein YafD